MTVAQMMTRDDFAKDTQKENRFLFMNFSTRLCRLTILLKLMRILNSAEQTRDLTRFLGRQIQEAYGKKYPQMVMLLPLIEGTDGLVKMSKTYPEHCISLTDSANDMFGKLMSIPDTLIVKYFTLLTDVSDEELKEIENKLKDPSINPRDLKLKLAYTITEEYHGKDGAEKAQAEFINVVSNKGLPSDIPEVKVEQGKNILDLLVELNFVQSKGEAKRLIQGGGVKIDGEKIADMTYALNFDESVILQAGKRKFAKLTK